MTNDEVVPAGKLLHDAYLARMEKNSSYSLRAFSRDLNLSHSHLSRVMSGRRNLSFRQAVELAALLQLEGARRAAFLQSVTEGSLKPAKPPAPRSKSSYLTLEVDNFKFLSEWYHSAILELIQLKDFQPEAKWIARKLGLTSRQVKMAVDRLQRLQLLELAPGKWKRTHNHLMVKSQPSGAIRAYHRQFIQKAVDELESGRDSSTRDITGTTIAIDPARLPELKERIRKFRKSLMELAAQHEATSLYQLNVQLFSLVKDKKP